jgi:hypothetical protein
MESQQAIAIAKIKRTRKPVPVDVDLEQIKQKLTIIAVENQLKMAEPERRDANASQAPVVATEAPARIGLKIQSDAMPKTSKPRIYIPLRINCSNEEFQQLLKAEETQLSNDSELEYVVFTSKANQTRFKKDSSRLKLTKSEAKFTTNSKVTRRIEIENLNPSNATPVSA